MRGLDLVHLLAQLSTNGVDRGCTKVTSVAEGAAEDVGECGFGHGIVHQPPGLVAFAEDGLVEDRVLESQEHFVLSRRDLLLLQVCKGVIPKQRPVLHGHGEQKSSVIVDEQVVLATGGAKHNIFRVAVVLDPSLIDLVDEPPPLGGCTLQHQFDIAVTETVGEEGGKSRSCPAVDAER
jgi:hypothetical protein